MKQEDLFQNFTPEERVEMLAQRAYKSDFESIRRPFDQDIKDQLKDTIVSETTVIMEQKAEMKKIVKEFNDAIKKNEAVQKDAIITLKRGYTENEEKVFFMDDQDNGLMHIYDAQGIYQSSRKLLPAERQSRVLSIATGTEG